MKLFSARETPGQNIAFLAFATGINAVISLIASFLPLSSLFLMFVIPLTSAFVAYYCKLRYCPVYLIASGAICIAASTWDIASAIFYAIPGLFIGYLYGILIKNRYTSSLVLFLCSLLQLGFFYASLAIINAILGIDMQHALLSLIGLGEKEGADIGFPLFAYGFSLAEISLTHLFIHLQIDRFGIEESKKLPWLAPAATVLFAGVAIVMAFLFPPVALVSTGLSMFWGIMSVIELVRERKNYVFIILGVLLIAGFLLFAGLYRQAALHGGVALLSFLPLMAGLSQGINLILLRRAPKEPKIEP